MIPLGLLMFIDEAIFFFLVKMIKYHICIFLGNLHEVLVELEGMGGGGKVLLEVSIPGEIKL